MKNAKSLYILMSLISTTSFGQITLEHTYPGSSNFINSPSQQQLYLIKLEVDGEKYVHIDRGNKVVNFYNLNHSFYKTISFYGATDLYPNANNMSILYISQNLFDNDNEIEFLYVDQNYPDAVTQIVNEDGSILFTENHAGAVVLQNVPQAQVPIYNTTAGTKMILSLCSGSLNTGGTNVYSLPGTLAALTVTNIENESAEFVLYPNPTTNTVTINSSKMLMAKINIVDLNGNTIETVNTNNSLSVELNVSNLSSGEYLLQIIDDQGKLIENKKIIKN